MKTRETKVPRTFRLTQGKVESAQEILGTETATETIEAALDLVVFRRELVDGTRAMQRIPLETPV